MYCCAKVVDSYSVIQRVPSNESLCPETRSSFLSLRKSPTLKSVGPGQITISSSTSSGGRSGTSGFFVSGTSGSFCSGGGASFITVILSGV